MTLTLPDTPALQTVSDQELRLELACALYARNILGKINAAEVAGMDLFAFQQALFERNIPSYSQEMLNQDLETMQKLFSK